MTIISAGNNSTTQMMSVIIGVPLIILISITAVVALVVAVSKLQKSKKTLKKRLTERE